MLTFGLWQLLSNGAVKLSKVTLLHPSNGLSHRALLFSFFGAVAPTAP
jgi:hypothetical protein